MMAQPDSWLNKNIQYLLALFSILVFTTASLFSQSNHTLGDYEIAIQQRFDSILPSLPDSRKAELNQSIEVLFTSALALPDAFSYPFDSLKKVGRITSRDEKLRMFTWNLMQNDGSHYIYGLMLYRRKNSETPVLFRLTDRKKNEDPAALKELGPETWFGALYYDIVEKKWNGITLYTLLGFDPNDIFTSRKIVDCLYVKDDNFPVFGAPVFLFQNNLQYRIIFEYSAKVSMSMRYNESMKMIVFDHLSPAKPSYTGSYQFYGPDFSYDGLKYENERWILLEDIDVRNR